MKSVSNSKPPGPGQGIPEKVVRAAREDRMSETELKPCPFCGGSGIKLFNNRMLAYVECISCMAAGPGGGKNYAVSSWNEAARADQPRPAVPDVWQPIETAPKDVRGVVLLIPYDPDRYSETERTDVGRWSSIFQCWRFLGDDGPHDLQPTHWKPIFAAQHPEGGD